MLPTFGALRYADDNLFSFRIGKELHDFVPRRRPVPGAVAFQHDALVVDQEAFDSLFGDRREELEDSNSFLERVVGSKLRRNFDFEI